MMGWRQARWMLVAAVSLALAGCAGSREGSRAKEPPRAATAEAAAGRVKVGRPYEVNGVWYYPKEQPGYQETGLASWYGERFHGRHTANGDVYDMNALTAAHKTLPLPSRVRVTNLENGRSIVLTVNDRGPFVNGRIIDVSRRAAQLLGFERLGTARVLVATLDGPAAPDSELVDERRMPAMPRAEVAAAPLAPPPGAEVAPPPEPAAAPVRVADAPPRPMRPSETAGPADNASGGGAAAPVDGAVVVVPVRPTQLFVQAGAFLRYDNANRLRARLAGFGPANISTATIDRQQFFRVRVGPLHTVSAADRLLNRVIAGGFPDARIVVE